MEYRVIALIAAMPEEIKPFLGHAGAYSREKIEGFEAWISDGAEEELGFNIGKFADRELNIRLGKVFLTITKKPWIVPQLLRLARNSRIAGENLAEALVALLEAL